MFKREYMPEDKLAPLVCRAQQGEHKAANELVHAIQPLIYKLALRFLWSPEDAEEIVQEVLLKVITRLSQFEGKSQFTTWVYSIASHHLLDLKRRPMEEHISFDDFSLDLETGLSDLITKDPEETILLEEIKIGCTLAMLQCLERDARMAYILGEILELDHQEAGEVLNISGTAFRKRLSRARETINYFMLGHCGLINPENPCRCSRRIKIAKSLGRINPQRLIFSTSQERAELFPEVLGEIRALEDVRRAAALYRSHPNPVQTSSFSEWLNGLLASDRLLLQ